MNMWHCKKQGPSRTGIYSESGRWQVTGDETLVKIDNVKGRCARRVASALLNDAIPVKFPFQFAT
jgi:hypothetical protein